MQTLEEFKTAHMPKRTGKGNRNIIVTNSWGVYDAYKLIRKNGWYNIGRPLKEKEFYAIVRGVNKLLAENIINGETVKFPEKMGLLELRKWEKGVSIVNGRLKVNYPIDWGETWKLWYNDPEAFKNKTLLRDEKKDIYSVRYVKNNANYENKLFYQFVLNRKIKKRLKVNIKNDKIDTLW